jgi:hypothetical protein
MMAFRLHFPSANSLCSNFRVCADLSDLDSAQGLARGNRRGWGFSAWQWRPLHFAADAGKLEIVKLLVAQGVKLNELTVAVYLAVLTSCEFTFNRSVLGCD